MRIGVRKNALELCDCLWKWELPARADASSLRDHLPRPPTTSAALPGLQAEPREKEIPPANYPSSQEVVVFIQHVIRLHGHTHRWQRHSLRSPSGTLTPTGLAPSLPLLQLWWWWYGGIVCMCGFASRHHGPGHRDLQEPCGAASLPRAVPPTPTPGSAPPQRTMEDIPAFQSIVSQKENAATGDSLPFCSHMAFLYLFPDLNSNLAELQRSH